MFVKVGQLGDFPEGRGRAVSLDGTRVAVFNVGGRLYALRDACPHMGASLADGRVADGLVECHWHGWRFELASGAGRAPAKSWACARRYDVRVEGQDVLLRLPDPAPERDDPPEDWVAWDERFLKKRGG